MTRILQWITLLYYYVANAFGKIGTFFGSYTGRQSSNNVLVAKSSGSQQVKDRIHQPQPTGHNFLCMLIEVAFDAITIQFTGNLIIDNVVFIQFHYTSSILCIFKIKLPDCFWNAQFLTLAVFFFILWFTNLSYGLKLHSKSCLHFLKNVSRPSAVLTLHLFFYF